MKKKKLVLPITILLIIIFILIFYKVKIITRNDISNKPNFVGTVVEFGNKGVLVLVDSNEEEYRSSDKISVSIDGSIKDNALEFKKGDRIKIFYDGAILESYPAQIHKPYKILKIAN